MRDKYLTEKMGECWHDFVSSKQVGHPFECSKCGTTKLKRQRPDFSTWPEFGKLWEWLEFKTTDGEEYDEAFDPLWFELQAKKICIGYDVGLIPREYINPDRFADAVYTFLKGREV